MIKLTLVQRDGAFPPSKVEILPEGENYFKSFQEESEDFSLEVNSIPAALKFISRKQGVEFPPLLPLWKYQLEEFIFQWENFTQVDVDLRSARFPNENEEGREDFLDFCRDNLLSLMEAKVISVLFGDGASGVFEGEDAIDEKKYPRELSLSRTDFLEKSELSLLRKTLLVERLPSEDREQVKNYTVSGKLAERKAEDSSSNFESESASKTSDFVVTSGLPYTFAARSNYHAYVQDGNLCLGFNTNFFPSLSPHLTSHSRCVKKYPLPAINSFQKLPPAVAQIKISLSERYIGVLLLAEEKDTNEAEFFGPKSAGQKACRGPRKAPVTKYFVIFCRVLEQFIDFPADGETKNKYLIVSRDTFDFGVGKTVFFHDGENSSVSIFDWGEGMWKVLSDKFDSYTPLKLTPPFVLCRGASPLEERIFTEGSLKISLPIELGGKKIYLFMKETIYIFAWDGEKFYFFRTNSEATPGDISCWSVVKLPPFFQGGDVKTVGVKKMEGKESIVLGVSFSEPAGDCHRILAFSVEDGEILFYRQTKSSGILEEVFLEDNFPLST